MCRLFVLVILVFAVTAQEDSTTGEPDVRMPPSIVQQYPEKIITFRAAFTKITLPCAASGSPEPSYSWKKNGRHLDLNRENFFTEPDSGTITIDPATSLDSGYYQCFANNIYGKAMSNVVFLQRAVLDSFSETDETPYTSIEGSPLTINCEDTKAVPEATYSWTLVDNVHDTQPRPLTLDSRVNIDGEGNLRFAYTKVADMRSGDLYACSIFNAFMATTVHGSYSSLKVTAVPGGPPKSKPSVAYSTQTPHVAVKGRSFSLKCLFSGNPEPNIFWSRVDGLSLPGGRFNVKAQSTELVIENVQDSDATEYKCRGHSSEGENSMVIRVLVEEEPVFVADGGPSDTNATDGEDIHFKCDASADPPATVDWFQNGEPLNVGSNQKMSLSDDGKTLTIKDVCKTCNPSELMVIQCNASNVHGYAFGAGYLNVLTPTVIFEAPEDQLLDFYKDVVFKCGASSDDSTTVSIRWKYESEYIFLEKDRFEQLPDGSLVIITEDDDDGGKAHQGNYTCEATNVYSTVNATAYLDVPVIAPPAKAGIGDYWWIFVIIAVIILLLLLLLICCICIQRNKGDSYPVDAKERANGHNPEKELADSGYHDYQRPEDEPVKGSRASLTSTLKMDSDDEGSLAEYGDIDAGKFNEDGSFIGQYTGEKKRAPNESKV